MSEISSTLPENGCAETPKAVAAKIRQGLISRQDVTEAIAGSVRHDVTLAISFIGAIGLAYVAGGSMPFVASTWLRLLLVAIAALATLLFPLDVLFRASFESDCRIRDADFNARHPPRPIASEALGAYNVSPSYEAWEAYMARRAEIIASIPQESSVFDPGMSRYLSKRRVLCDAKMVVLWGALGWESEWRPNIEPAKLPVVIELLRAACMGQAPAEPSDIYRDRKLVLGGVVEQAESIFSGFPCASYSRLREMTPSFIALALERFEDDGQSWVGRSQDEVTDSIAKLADTRLLAQDEAFGRFMSMIQGGADARGADTA